MYIVGIDIAKRTHEAIVIDREGAIILKPFNFKNSKDGFQYFMQKLNSISTSTSDFTFAMESTSHYWIALYSALMKTSSSIHVINPLQSSALRNLYIRKVKSDSHDCFVIAEVIRFGRFTRNTLPSPQLYELRELCRGRTFIVDMCSDLKKKTIALLDQVFPEYESIFSDIFGQTSSALLLQYPTPQEILSITPKKLAKFISLPSKNRFGTEKANEIYSLAQNSFGIILGIETISLLIKNHIAQIQFMQAQVKEIDKRTNSILLSLETQITTIPGVGVVLGAAIVSEIGDVTRFSSSGKLTAFAGIDPTINSSGEFQSTRNHMSKRGSPYLRRAIWQASTLIIMHDPIFRAYFDKKRAEGKSYMNAIGHVTRKLMSVIYAVLRDNKPYYCNIE